MTVHGDCSPEARALAQEKARAATVFGEHAEAIVAALPDVPDGHVLVAVVDETQMLSGMHHVAFEYDTCDGAGARIGGALSRMGHGVQRRLERRRRAAP